jgi:hypothetical protein
MFSSVLSFSWSINILHGGITLNILQFSIKKNLDFAKTVFKFSLLSNKNLGLNLDLGSS